MNNGFEYEPEGIDFQGDKLWICDQPGNFFEVQEQEALKPTETKSVRTLSFPDGWRQNYAQNGNEGYWNKDSCNGYTKPWTAATQDLAYTFTMDSINHYGSMNDWSFVRIGRKGHASKAFITTDQPVSESILPILILQTVSASSSTRRPTPQGIWCSTSLIPKPTNTTGLCST